GRGPGRRPAVPGPGPPARGARPLRDAHAGLPGDTAGGPRRSKTRRGRGGVRSPSDLATAVLQLAPVPRDPVPVLVGTRTRGGLRGSRPTLGGDRRRDLRSAGRHTVRSGLPTASAAAPFQHRAHLHHRPGYVGPAAPRPASRG